MSNLSCLLVYWFACLLKSLISTAIYCGLHIYFLLFFKFSDISACRKKLLAFIGNTSVKWHITTNIFSAKYGIYVCIQASPDILQSVKKLLIT